MLRPRAGRRALPLRRRGRRGRTPRRGNGEHQALPPAALDRAVRVPGPDAHGHSRERGDLAHERQLHGRDADRGDERLREAGHAGTAAAERGAPRARPAPPGPEQGPSASARLKLN